jgi:hypothetical protein
MGNRLLGSIVVAVIAAGAMSGVVARAQDRVAATALKTPWGEPDLQGIWTDEVETPLQRPVLLHRCFAPSGRTVKSRRSQHSFASAVRLHKADRYKYGNASLMVDAMKRRDGARRSTGLP